MLYSSLYNHCLSIPRCQCQTHCFPSEPCRVIVSPGTTRLVVESVARILTTSKGNVRDHLRTEFHRRIRILSGADSVVFGVGCLSGGLVVRWVGSRVESP